MDVPLTKQSEPTFEELRTLDAEFLHLEDALSPLHIAALCVFEGPAVTKAELEHFMLGALLRLPRYRRKLRRVPWGLGRPVWIDDRDFDIRQHVHDVTLLEGEPETRLLEVMQRLLAVPLERHRPLWDAWLVYGLPQGRWALIARMHHAMVDGISGMSLLRALLAEGPSVQRQQAVAWSAAPEPKGRALLAHAWGRLARDVQGARRALLHGLREPKYAARATMAVAAGLMRFGVRLYARRTSSLQGDIGSRRRFALRIVSLAELKQVRRAFGCTINDVVLALLSGGYRALLAAQGDEVAHARVRSLIPVSLRELSASSLLDNRLSAMVCTLPVHMPDPAQRLRAVTAQMRRLKHAHMVEAGAWFMHVGDFIPPLLIESVSRKVAQYMHRHPQRMVSTITTNVPGPQVPLFLLGRRLVHWIPHVPITQGTRVASACLSYNGELAFGVTADARSIADLTAFTQAIAADLATLLTYARAPEDVRRTEEP